MNDACPRCGTKLEATEHQRVPYERCTGCSGLLVEQPRLIPLLDALSAKVGEHVAEVGAIPPVPDQPGTATCPECQRTMERFGYMEARVVFLDRCTKCRLVWIDVDELATMVIMHARLTHRAAAQDTEREELVRHLTALVFAVNRPEIRM
jgi:Zn-finger nucleic acid-binding protein